MTTVLDPTPAVPRRTQLSRRQILGGAAILGWSAATASWVTTADAAPLSARAPRFRGTFELADTADYRTDFGRLITAEPRAVLTPASADDVVQAVRYARRCKVSIAMNGQSGTGAHRESHSNYGQALTRGGIEVNARGLSRILSIGDRSALVEAGVSWADLTEATLARGLVPAALTDYLRISVGGTISVGGIGGSVHRYGLQCDTVQRIDIVTGEGDLVTATPSRNADLFNAALGGGGQVGIIVAARIALVPAPKAIGLHQFFYDNLATFLADQQRALASRRFEHLSGEVARRADDTGWRWKLELGVHDPATAPSQQDFFDRLSDQRAERVSEVLPFAEWVFRVDGFETALREAGYWEEPKPWLSLFVPASSIKQVVQAVTGELTANDLGAGFSILSPFPRSKATRPMFALPSDEVVYLFDLLRFPHPGEPGIAGMLAQNRRFYDLAVAAGGKRYLVGAIPDMTTADWKRHFGGQYATLAQAKRRYDPSNILTPGQGFFG